jgi:V/A-type H+-transporting ATPase subunit C
MKYISAHAVSSHDKRYAYATGRIRSLETGLLGKQRLERLAEASGVEEAVRLLSDTSYAAHLDELQELGYEEFLRAEEGRLLDLVDSLSLDQEVSDVIRTRYDYHNLKVALREQISGRDLERLYLDLGRHEWAAIREAVKVESLQLLPEPLFRAAEAAVEAYGRTQDPARMDFAVDLEMFGRFLSLARRYPGSYAAAIVRTWIDLANLRSFMRGRYLGLEAGVLTEVLIPGGELLPELLFETYPLTLEEMLPRFEFSPYRRIMEVGGAGLEKEGSFVPLEREIDSYQISFLRLSRYFTFGLEVVLAYALLRQNEIRMLRLILAAGDRGVAPETVKERIPDVH